MVTAQRNTLGDENQEMIQFAKERLNAYRFLATVYSQIPNTNWISQLLAEEVINSWSGLAELNTMNKKVFQGLELIQVFTQEAREKNLEEVQTLLAKEYTQLFRGLRLGDISPPYESVYRGTNDGLFSKEVLSEVRSFYRLLGISPCVTDQPDYIGIEFDLMRYLLEKEIEAWENNQLEKVVESIDQQKQFMQSHISAWVPIFCEGMLSQAGSKFYQGIALITIGFIEDDFNQFDRICNQQVELDKEANELCHLK